MRLSLVLLVALCFGVTLGEYVNFLSDAYIDQLNQQGLPWKAGRNFQANLTEEDMVRMFGPPPTGLPEYPHPSERRTYTDSDPIPEEFDGRTHFKKCSDVIGTIPDAGACGSLYAFSVASVASDRLCVVTQGRINKLLSAEYIVSCCKKCRLNGGVCDSGISSSTWEWVHKRGLVTGGGYKSNIGCQPVSFPTCNHTPNPSSLPSCGDLEKPKPKCHTRCLNEKYSKNFFQDKYRFKKYYWLDENVEAIQSEILQYGSVIANMYFYDDLFSYKDGVYRISPSAVIRVYMTVKIVGWGKEGNLPYWTVIPPLGKDFGNKGTFKILRGHNEAIIESLVNGAVPRGNYNAEGYSVSEYPEEEDLGFEDFE